MRPFRLNSIRISSDNYSTKEIQLINKDVKINDNNYFSLIIGNNGTGKSRLLSIICRYFTNKKDATIRNLSVKANYIDKPKKVIAITHSISDKFPMDNVSLSNRRNNQEVKYLNQEYIYLGTRNNIYASSSKSSMYRAIDILFENYSEKKIAQGYRHIFDYLGYEPIIKLSYKITNLRRKNLLFNGIVTIESLKEHLINKIDKDKGGFRRNKILNILDNEQSLREICEFYNSHINEDDRSYNLTVNFSENNISRLENDEDIYLNKFKINETLKLMRAVDLVAGFEIKVYKKGGKEFDFSDASSGEASVLSTLIALIPLITNNSLVIIDEPEISLHPSWQSQYINLLKKIFQNVKGCHIIIATHSHFLVSDLPIKTSSVIAFSNDKNIIDSKLIESETFGWSAEDILLNIFKLPTTRNYYMSKMVSEALEILADEKKDFKRLFNIKDELKEFYPLMKEEDPLRKVIKIILDYEAKK